ncbi:MAG: cell division protein FtsA [Leptospirales bacterium]|nr:cell division protein FtsA [Leptospirales bacterium]
MNETLCCIDIGSSLCHALIGRMQGEDAVEILGVGSTPSRGVRAGAIVNIESAVQCIGEAVREAELMSGQVVEEAVINITGRHLRGENSRGVAAVAARDHVITEGDVFRVIEGAQQVRIPADQEIIHVLSRQFTVDYQDGVRDPVGMSGARLEADVHIVTASSSALANLQKAVHAAGLECLAVVMNSLASAEATLSQEERDLGVAIVDLGGGTTDIVLYVDGGVCYSAVAPLGSLHVSQDLSIGLKLPLEAAELIKRTCGAALASIVDPTERIELPGASGRPARHALRQQAAMIIEPRMREILEMVGEELDRSGQRRALAGGVILTGGGSLLEGVEELAEDVLNLSCSVRAPRNTLGFADRVASPEFSTAVGMLYYASRMTPSTRSEARQRAGGIVTRIRSWLSENL